MCPIHNKPGEPAMLVLCAPPTSLLGERKKEIDYHGQGQGFQQSCLHGDNSLETRKDGLPGASKSVQPWRGQERDRLGEGGTALHPLPWTLALYLL